MNRTSSTHSPAAGTGSSAVGCKVTAHRPASKWAKTRPSGAFFGVLTEPYDRPSMHCHMQMARSIRAAGRIAPARSDRQDRGAYAGSGDRRPLRPAPAAVHRSGPMRGSPGRAGSGQRTARAAAELHGVRQRHEVGRRRPPSTTAAADATSRTGRSGTGRPAWAAANAVAAAQTAARTTDGTPDPLPAEPEQAHGTAPLTRSRTVRRSPPDGPGGTDGADPDRCRWACAGQAIGSRCRRRWRPAAAPGPAPRCRLRGGRR